MNPWEKAKQIFCDLCERIYWWWCALWENQEFIYSLLIVLCFIFWVGVFTIVGWALPKKTQIKETTLKASWYSVDSLKKEGTWKNGERRMANGERFREDRLTAASRIFALGSIVRVINLSDGHSVVVTITDRISKRFAKTRIDLSKGAFVKIADLKQGVVPVKVERIKL